MKHTGGYPANAICGSCGTNRARNTDAFCINGHDHWIEKRDFDEPDLKGYIGKAAHKLGVTVPKLKEHVERDEPVITNKASLIYVQLPDLKVQD